MPGGPLGIAGADKIIPIVNNLAQRTKASGGVVVYTADMHPPGHSSFKASGGLWPAHCVANTLGQQFHPDLDASHGPTFHKGTEIDKDSYSGFGNQTLEEYLRKNGVQRVTVVGLALDYCVKATAVDAKKRGFDTRIILVATKSVAPDKLEDIIKDIESSGVQVVRE